MIWLNVPTNIANTKEVSGASCEQGMTWFRLMLYCASQENSGVIKDAKTLNARNWMAMCGVELSILNEPSELWVWDGNDLEVLLYPIENEIEFHAKRERKRKAGEASARKRQQEKEELERLRELSCSTGVEQQLNERKSKEKKGKAKQGKGREEPDFDDVFEFLSEQGDPEAFTNARSFLDAMEDEGWCDQEGNPIRNWKGLAKRWYMTPAGKDPKPKAKSSDGYRDYDPATMSEDY